MSPQDSRQDRVAVALLAGLFRPYNMPVYPAALRFTVIRQQLATWVTGSMSAFAIVNDSIFPRRFAEAMRSGAYLRTIVDGTVRAGTRFESLGVPITITPCGMCPASALVIAIRSNGYWRFPR